MNARQLARELDTSEHRVETILTLLEHLPDYDTTLVKSGEGSGGNPLLMPRMWGHPSVRELHRTLDRLKTEARIPWFHLQTFYRAPWRTITPRRRVRTTKGYRWEDGPPQLARVLPAGLVIALKDQGVRFTIVEFQGEPFLPDELLSELPAEILSA